MQKKKIDKRYRQYLILMCPSILIFLLLVYARGGQMQPAKGQCAARKGLKVKIYTPSIIIYTPSNMDTHKQ